MKRQHLIFETKIVDKENRIIEIVGSTESFDRIKDRMLMSGAKLNNYLKNPIILPNHDYTSQAIAKALNVVITDKRLIFKIQFAETELGNEWFYLYANKYMNAASIGFYPIKYKLNEEGGYDYIEWELLELSLVTVPCNPEAIQRAFKDGHISKLLYDKIIKDGEDEVKLEDIQKILDETLKPIGEKIKLLEAKSNEKSNEPETKSGATLSKSSMDTLSKVIEGLKEHCGSLEKFIKDCSKEDQPEGEGKGEKPDITKDEFTEEDVMKLVEENIKKYLE